MIDKLMNLRVSDFEERDYKISELSSCHLIKGYFPYILLLLEDGAARRNA